MEWEKMKMMMDHFGALPEALVHRELNSLYYSR